MSRKEDVRMMLESVGFAVGNDTYWENVKSIIYNYLEQGSDIVVDGEYADRYCNDIQVREKGVYSQDERNRREIENYKRRRVFGSCGCCDIPVNNLDFLYYASQIADKGGIKRTFPASRNTTWGWEVEGGSDLSYAEIEDLCYQYNHILQGDCTARVSRVHNDELEIIVDGYYGVDKLVDGVNDIRRLLRELNYQTSDRCGIHIHVGNLEPKTVLKLYYFFTEIEDYLYAFLTRGREDYGYSQKSKNLEFARKIKEVPVEFLEKFTKATIENIMSGEHLPRTSINIGSYLTRRGTVEFRLFDHHYQYIEDYIALIDCIIAFVQESDFARLKDVVYRISRKHHVENGFVALAGYIGMQENHKKRLYTKIFNEGRNQGEAREIA